MAKLRNVVYLTKAQKDILFTPGGTVGGISYDANDLYIVLQLWDIDGSASDYLYIKDFTGFERVRVSNNGMVRAAGFEGSGALLTNLSASSITSGTIDVARLPSIALTDRFVFATPTDFETAYSANHNLLQKGDVVIFTTNKETYIHNGGTAWSMSDLTKLETPTDLVASVNGKAGVVVIGPTDIAWTSSHRTVTDSEKSTWNNKVAANTAITGATKTKITYDSKGLVTGGTDLVASDIPLLNQNTTGNAATATKLANLRTISLGTGITGTATGFDGSSNITIPVTSISEAYLAWGGKSLSGSYGPIDAAMVDELGANRFAFYPENKILVEYSLDAGSTWLDYEAAPNEKINLFNGVGAVLRIGKNASTGIDYTNYRLRVTLNSTQGSLYTTLNKFVILASTNGSGGTWVTIEGRLQSDIEASNNTWSVFSNQTPISGWSGYNVINISGFTTYGNSNAKPYQYGEVRFIFGGATANTSYAGLQILKILGFGGVGWSTPSNLAKSGNIYSYNHLQEVAFPAKVTAPTFVGALTGTASGNLPNTHAVSGVTTTLIDQWNAAYTHAGVAHAPSNAQKNSDITKAEIEAKLTGAITSHTHAYLSSTHDAKDVTAALIGQWNAAYGWGNHAGLYSALGHNHNTAYLGISAQAADSLKLNGQLASYYQPASTAMTTSHPANAINSTNISNWNTAHGWGNHAGLYRSSTWYPSWSDVSGKPNTFAPIIGSGAADAVAGNDPRLTNSRSASDVYTWAKQSVKPTYNFSEIGNTPTTLSDYGITDGMTATAINSAISTAISNLVASSPATLDTLNELAAALGDDPAFATTMTNLIGTKVTANTAITEATKTKITYDAKGLVTGGADLSASDIPPLAYVPTSKLLTTDVSNGINPNNVVINTLGYANNLSLLGQTDGAIYAGAYGSSWVHEIYGDFRTGQIAVRGKENGTWRPWRTVRDTINFVSGIDFAPAHSHPYRPDNWVPNASDIANLDATHQWLTDAYISTWNNKSDAHTHPYLSDSHDAKDVTATLIGKWNAAYGWGDHASAGYAMSGHNHNTAYLGISAQAFDSLKLNGQLASYYQPASTAMTTSHAANGITSTNISNWNTAHGWGNHAGLYRSSTWYPSWSDVSGKIGSAYGTTSGTFAEGNHTHSSIEPTGLEWQPVYSAYSTNGTSIDVLSGKAALPANGYEYKVVMVATTPDEDASEPTIQLNGVTSASYSYMWSRTQSTNTDTATETHTSDTTGASAIYTGCGLHTFAGAGTGSRTVVRLEFTITPIVGHSDGYFSFTVQGTCSSLFTGTAAQAGSALSNFVGTLYGYNTSSSISSILITHSIGAGMPDQASVYVYRRSKGF